MKYRASLSQIEYVNRHTDKIEKCLDNIGNIPIIFETNAAVDQKQIIHALQNLINENEIFRTKYVFLENKLYQEVISELELMYEENQIGSDSDADIIDAINQYINRNFNIGKPEYLYRVAVYKTPNRVFWVLCLNKLICDFASRFIIINKIYANIRLENNTEKSGVDYIDFSEWQSNLDEDYIEKAQFFWKSKIRQDMLQPNLSNASREGIYKNHYYTLSIDKKMQEDVFAWCKNNGFSHKSFYLAVIKFVFSRICNSNCVLIHFEADRVVDEIKETIGLCSNTVPLIMRLDEKNVFKFLNQKINNEIEKVENNSVLPIDIVCKKQNYEIDKSYVINPTILFRFYEYAEMNESCGIKVSKICPESVGNSLVVEVIKSPNGTDISIYYNSQYYLREFVKEYAYYIMNVIPLLIDKHEIMLGDISLLNKKQMYTVVDLFNKNESNYKIEKNVSEILEMQFILHDKHTALSEKGINYSYAELQDKIYCVANKLKKLGIKNGDYIIIHSKHSALTIIGICAIVIAGAVYIPIDFNMPKERMEFIIKDCNPSLALYDNDDSIMLDYNIPAIDLKSCLNENISEDNKIENTNISPKSLIYIMYTSGTTGNPKGVIIEHKNVVRLACHGSYVNLNENTNLLLTGSLSFDAVTFEIWGTLLNGGTLHIVDNDVLLNEDKIKYYINNNKINTMWLTAALFNQFVDNDIEVFDQLDTLLIGGEKLSEKHVTKLLAQNSNINLINGYGPTETTTFATTYSIDKRFKYNTIPIGRPITNTSIFVVNQHHICGIGMIGEICIGGDGVGRGYLNNDELTKEKFVYNEEVGERIYKSGDLGRWLPDGTLEYLGRNDNQVKIRGYRIETSEIEAAIKNFKYIDDAAVTIKEANNEKYICVYYVSEQKIVLSNLKEFLKDYLPVFMMPTYYFKIQRIPLTSNGKKDYDTLPFYDQMSCNEYVKPRNKTEERLQSIFANILNKDQIGVKDNFFELGGHSLKAVKVLNEIEKFFNKRISLKTFFENPTIEYLAHILEDMSAQKDNIVAAADKEYYELSPAQRRIYTGGLYDDTGIAYNVNFGMWVKEKIDYYHLKITLQKLIDSHDSLKTAFIIKDGEIVQKIICNAIPVIDYEEISIATDQEAENQLKQYVSPFDLSNPPLIRVKLLKNNIGNDILLFSVHHIIADGISINILINDFISLYHNKQIRKPAIRYIDYSEWINHTNLSDQKIYWKNFINNQKLESNFPTDYSCIHATSYKGDQERIYIGDALRKEIELFCRRKEITTNIFFLTVFHLLVHKYTGENEIIVGSPVNARTIQGSDAVIGMFVNTLGTKSRFDKEMRIYDLIKQISESTKEMLSNQDYPLDVLINSRIEEQNIQRSSLFDLMFSYQNVVNENSYGDFLDKPIHFVRNTSKFNLTLTVSEKDTGYEVDIEYLTELFSKQSILYVLSHYSTLIDNIINNPERKISQISILNRAEEELVIDTFAYGENRFNKLETVYSTFKNTVRDYPDKKALIKYNDYLTYKMLDKKSDIVAQYLLENGVKRQDKVIIIAEKNFDTIITLVACVKLSAIYIMVDSEYPKERIKYIISQTLPKAIVICDGRQMEKGISFSDINLDIDYIKNISYMGNSEDVLNVIYTSGTTGKPKGVIISQKGVLRLVKEPSYITLSKDSVILQASSLSFDACTFEIWGVLLNGGTLCLADKEQIINPKEIKNVIDVNRINTLFLTTALFNHLVTSDAEVFEKVNYVLFGGESASDSCVSLFKRKYQECYLCNMYGPTEASTFTTFFNIKDVFPKKIPIGKPINDTSVFILKDNDVCGIGIVGEICIGGIGVSQGYYNMPEMTKDKFINVLIGGKMEYLYRSGDLGRWLPDGNIEFWGRNDNQIKLNGNRIELEEISNTLRSKKEIKDVVTILKTIRGNKLICTYFTSDKKQDTDNIVEYLSKYLTSNMMPAIVTQIPEIPLTINGKVNISLLPETNTQPQSYLEERPANEFEEKLLGVFEELLNVSPISLNDNFYELGGDSIKAIRLIAKLKDMGFALSARDILKSKVISRILTFITKDTKSYEQNAISGYYELTPIQNMFFEWNLPHKNYFNQSIVLEFKSQADNEIIKNVIESIIKHHDVLRSILVDKKMYIREVEEVESNLNRFYNLRIIDLPDYNSEVIDRISSEVQSSLNIQQGPMIGIALFNIENKKSYCMLCIHHLLVDGISWRVLIEDFVKAYYGKVLGFKTASYIEWSAYLTQYWRSHDMQKEADYWNNIALLAEKDDWRQYRDGNGTGSITVSENLNKGYTSNLSKAAAMYNTDIKTILLTALSSGIYKWRKKDEFIVSLEGHGREILDKEIDISRTVGWFTSIYPFPIKYNSDIEKAIIINKENLNHIPRNGIGYGILHQHKQINMGIEPEICFNYLGEWDQYNNEDFSVINKSFGDNISSYNNLINPISINAQIIENQLEISIILDTSKYTIENIQNLLQNVVQSIEEIETFCLKQKEIIKTASDYDDDLSEEALEEIYNLL